MNSKPVILFDGVCNLCNSSVNFVLDRDKNGEFKFGTLQSAEGKRLIQKLGAPDPELSSIILIERIAQSDATVYVESDAALRIMMRLPGVWKIFGVFRFLPRILRDGIYRWVSRNRYRWFGKRDVCRIPTAELEDRFIERLR